MFPLYHEAVLDSCAYNRTCFLCITKLYSIHVLIIEHVSSVLQSCTRFMCLSLNMLPLYYKAVLDSCAYHWTCFLCITKLYSIHVLIIEHVSSVLQSCTRFMVHVYVVYASHVCETFVHDDIQHPLISTCACIRMHFAFDQTSNTSKFTDAELWYACTHTHTHARKRTRTHTRESTVLHCPVPRLFKTYKLYMAMSIVGEENEPGE